MQNKLKFWQDDTTSCLTEDVEQARVSLHLVKNLSPHKMAGGPSETRRVFSPHDPFLPSLPCGTARVFPSCLGNPSTADRLCHGQDGREEWQRANCWAGTTDGTPRYTSRESTGHSRRLVCHSDLKRPGRNTQV